MIKTIKICDKCGKETNWLYTVPFMHIQGLTLAYQDNTPNGTVKNEFCENCTRRIISKIDDIIINHNF